MTRGNGAGLPRGSLPAVSVTSFRHNSVRDSGFDNTNPNLDLIIGPLAVDKRGGMWRPAKTAKSQYVFNSKFSANVLKLWAIVPVDVGLSLGGN